LKIFIVSIKMLDLMLIQDDETGITYFEYKPTHARINNKHAPIFSGFLSAIQNVSKEMEMGKLTQISTETHHCLINAKPELSVILIVDVEDDIKYWRRKMRKTAQEFLKEFPNAKRLVSHSSRYLKFFENLQTFIPELD